MDSVINALAGVVDPEVVAASEKKCREQLALRQQLATMRPLGAQLAATTTKRNKAVKAVGVLRQEIVGLEALLRVKHGELLAAESPAQQTTASVDALVNMQQEDARNK